MPKGYSDRYPEDWNKRRKKVYKRDNYECQSCGKRGGPYGDFELHADHITPISEGGSHKLSNLRTLCKTCHVQRHTATGGSFDILDLVRPYWATVVRVVDRFTPDLRSDPSEMDTRIRRSKPSKVTTIRVGSEMVATCLECNTKCSPDTKIDPNEVAFQKDFNGEVMTWYCEDCDNHYRRKSTFSSSG